MSTSRAVQLALRSVPSEAENFELVYQAGDFGDMATATWPVAPYREIRVRVAVPWDGGQIDVNVGLYELRHKGEIEPVFQHNRLAREGEVIRVVSDLILSLRASYNIG